MRENNCDVVVAGGGISGCFAALAAAKVGAKVSLVESSGTVGGISVEGPLEAFMTFHDEDGPISTRMTEEFVDRLVKAGGSPGFTRDTVGYCKTIVPYDAEILRNLLFKMLEEKKVDILLNSPVSGAETNDTNVNAAMVSNKENAFRLKASAFVDATGDGDLAFHAGAKVMVGRKSDGKVQPMTLLFVVAGVDTNALKKYVFSNRDKFKMDWSIIDEEPETLIHLWGFKDILERGYSEQKLSLLRSEMQAMESVMPGTYVINYTRFFGDPLSPEEVSKAQQVTIRQAHELTDFLRSTLPGFSKAYISRTGKLGIRESRRIVGRYILEEDDVLHSKHFDDAVVQGAFPIDIHQPDGNSLAYTTITKAYTIPASCLTSKDFNNLFMSGRCISASHEAMASTRISATAMSTGQAAGVLAAMEADSPGAEFPVILDRMRKIGASRF